MLRLFALCLTVVFKQPGFNFVLRHHSFFGGGGGVHLEAKL